MWLLYFSLFLTGLTPFAQCDYLDVEPDLDNPYAFHMFENVNLCHEVFHQEREFIQSLRDARHNLVEKIQSLRDLRNKSIDTEIVSKAAAAIVSSGERTVTMLQRLNESKQLCGFLVSCRVKTRSPSRFLASTQE